MTDFLKAVEENSVTYRDKPFIADPDRELSFGEFYEVSSRVYAYLKQRGIGHEDFVLICLPRGSYPIAAFLGVLRAGAAFVITEDTLPAERIEFIRMDCGCKLALDSTCWDDVMRTAPLAGYEERDVHSAAFAVYTSGTTGRPKGVLHEYGNIGRTIASSFFKMEEERFVLCSPINFVVSHLELFVLLVQASFLYVIPYAVLKDPMQFKAFLMEQQITAAFLSPLFIKKMAPLLKSLHFCGVGAEPANDLYFEDLDIVNGYTMSEVCFIITLFKIDKSYPNTPVGNSVGDHRILLLGEDGQEVAAGEKGEIVVENPYVRGYINLPEKTAAAFKDGWYHTGDLGMWDDEGRLVVCGRFDDMAKVNGNRVEPGEIEIVAREVLNLGWAAAKVFTDRGKPFVCLYYLGEPEIDPEEARAKMAERLPHYMIPAFFIRIDEIPLTAAGKFNRRALRAPVLDEERAEYRAPETDEQRALCEAFAKVFNVAGIGIGDDFSHLGGDSVDAMEIVVSSGLEGLSVTDVLQGRTPEGIAALYAKRATAEDPDAVNARALTKDYPLTPDQAYTVEWQLREPESIMRNVCFLLKLDNKVIDMARMAAAIVTAARNHPALFTEIYRAEDGELRQRFASDMLPDAEVEHLTEEEFAQVKGTLVKPFTMIQEPLFRLRVFETEAAGYVFMDVHHAVFDGSSQSVFMQDIIAAYMGGELSRDYYPYILETQGCVAGSAGYEENKAYFEKRYGGVDWCRHLAISGEAKESAIGITKSALPVTAQQLDQVEKKLGVSRNGFFAVAAAMAMAACEDTCNVMLFWTFNGRTDVKELHSVGSLRCGLPLGFAFSEDATLEELCASVNEQVNADIAHCRYPYLEQNQAILDEGVTRVLYQGSMQAIPQEPGFLGLVPLSRDSLVSRAFLNLEIADAGEGFALTTKHTASCFAPEDIEKFTEIFNSALTVLASHASDPSVTCAQLQEEISEALS